MTLEIQGMQKHRQVLSGLVQKLKRMSPNFSSSNNAFQEILPKETCESVESFVDSLPKPTGGSEEVAQVQVGNTETIRNVRNPVPIANAGVGNAEVVQQLLATARALAKNNDGPSGDDIAVESRTVSPGKKFKIQEYGSFVRDIRAVIEMISFLREHTVRREKFITKLQAMKRKKIRILVTLIQIQQTYKGKFYFSRKKRQQRQIINDAVTKYIENIKNIEMKLHKYTKKRSFADIDKKNLN